MEIIIAKYSGFCSGVKIAVELVEKNISNNTVTFGPLVHNQSVTDYFKRKGVDYIESPEGINNKTVIVRSHGVSPEVISKLEAGENTVINGTCPFVTNVQRIAKNIIENNKQLIILGDKNHPEVIGINGWAKYKGIIINDLEELQGYQQDQDQDLKLDLSKPIGVVVQTTFNMEKFHTIISKLREQAMDIEVHNTICKATNERQSAVRDMAEKVDMVLVIGGKESSNTAKLTSICKSLDVVTYQIEEAKEIDPSWLNNIKSVGITAGASTPDWIIREVISMVNELNGQEEVKGEEQENAWETIQAAFENKTALTAKAVEVVKGGILIDLGIRAFMPASLLDTRFVEDLNQFVGQDLTFYVKELDKEKNKVILSRKDLLLEEQQGAQNKAFANLKEGQRVKGTVKRMADFGAFVDIGGVDGLVHVSNLSWNRVNHPSEVLEVGQEVEVDILKLDEEKQKISLSLKSTQPSPFESNIKAIKQGEIVEGKIVRLADFGAFVELAPQVDGLVHISQISDDHISKPAEVLAVGQQVKVKILEVDAKSKRISLSIKEAKTKEDFSQYAQTESLNVTLGDRFADLFKKED
ncbi:30S ribosomal protein S1 [Alkalicella caledoniensis]|uniref:4-hydroxy-3-methylbut-2-enyl diphosphate reductase n=1 Tax=Alkalicella caledoniensis TaxID=2731377 RepID=A0A7G9W4C5_ALKCA|nr:30S ribosomal protein S1 [Alkalicella caledoniensis]QNO13537.1 30S ribosomal protein S1 [Alkalicella caledoniensis]